MGRLIKIFAYILLCLIHQLVFYRQIIHLIMTYILSILLFIISGVLSDVYAEKCDSIKHKSPSLKVLQYLFCDYDPTERPTKDVKNATKISIMLFPKILEFNDYSNTMHLHTWVQMSWRDEYLQWDEIDFHETVEVPVLLKNIWVPDIYIENAASADNIRMETSTRSCWLQNTGLIDCIMSVVFSIRCNAEYTYWPFDNPNCNIELSSWAYNQGGIAFDKNQIDVKMNRLIPNVEWTITPISTSRDNKKSRHITHEEFPIFVLHFLLERSGSQLWNVFGTPTIILAAMTLTTLWLNPKSDERIMIACTNFFCHFLCIRTLHWTLPKSDAIPNILMFYHNSMILAVIALILTCLFRKIVDAKDSPIPCISSILLKIMSSKLGYILSLIIIDSTVTVSLERDSDDNSDLVNNPTSKKSAWIYVIIILGWVSFISSLFMYITMVAAYLWIPFSVK